MIYAYKTTKSETPMRVVSNGTEISFIIKDAGTYFNCLDINTETLTRGRHLLLIYNKDNEILNSVYIFKE